MNVFVLTIGGAHMDVETYVFNSMDDLEIEINELANDLGWAGEPLAKEALKGGYHKFFEDKDVWIQYYSKELSEPSPKIVELAHWDQSQENDYPKRQLEISEANRQLHISSGERSIMVEVVGDGIAVRCYDAYHNSPISVIIDDDMLDIDNEDYNKEMGLSS